MGIGVLEFGYGVTKFPGLVFKAYALECFFLQHLIFIYFLRNFLYTDIVMRLCPIM